MISFQGDGLVVQTDAGEYTLFPQTELNLHRISSRIESAFPTALQRKPELNRQLTWLWLTTKSESYGVHLQSKVNMCNLNAALSSE